MNRLTATAALLSLILPAAALSQTPAEPPAPEQAEVQAEPTGPLRPGDESGAMMPSDGIAECAAILAVASSQSTNIIERNRMHDSASIWFAASGDLASVEGTVPEDGLWEKKVTDWSTRIGGMASLTQNGDWMTYCAEIGQQQGLDTGHFVQYAPPPAPVEQAAEQPAPQG